VTDLDFIKRENSNGRDSVQVAFSMEYATDNISRRFVNRIQSSVARVSAATFDANIVPGGSTYDIGTSASQWRDGYFSSKVGIGVSSPQTPLHVAGGNIYASDDGSGMVFKGPNGTSCYLFTLSNAGLITTSSVACP
jgi:hypothetical protein